MVNQVDFIIDLIYVICQFSFVICQLLFLFLSPSIHKFEDELIYSGLSAERAKSHNQAGKIRHRICESKH